VKKGLEMWSIKSLAEADMEKALFTAADIGYQGVEFAGFYDNTAKDVARWLKKYGLEAFAAHVPANLIFLKPEETASFHREISNNRVICPFYALHSQADVEELAQKIRLVAPFYRENGIKLQYHNHSHEMQRDGGERIIDRLAQAVTPQELWLEFDVYWVYRGGADPVEYLNRYEGRMDLFHAKDGTMHAGTVLGQGNVDLKRVFEVAKKQGLEWAVVESETDNTIEGQVEAVRRDFAALTELMK